MKQHNTTQGSQGPTTWDLTEGSGLSIPEEHDFESLAMMKALAFAEKSWDPPRKNIPEIVGILRKYAQIGKLAHCRVCKDKDGQVLGGIQLQLEGDCGDHSLPEGMRHELRPGEAYVEWIACRPDATGRGIGSQLLKWADSFAASRGASFISLDVMKKNEGAVKLYERKGYAVTVNKNEYAVDRFFTGLFVWTFMGCKYWTVLHMQKALEQTECEATDASEVQPLR